MPVWPRLKHASALISHGGVYLGTGYLVDSTLVATCHHVVSDVPAGAQVDCTFRSTFQERKATALRWSEEGDIALLALDRAPDGVEPLSVEPVGDEVDDWQAHGYPGFARERGVVLEGRIMDPDDYDPQGRPVMSLFSQMLLGEQPEGEGVGGISGSPVVARERVIGQISRVLGAKGAGPRAQLGYCYAISSRLVRDVIASRQDGLLIGVCKLAGPAQENQERTRLLAALFAEIKGVVNPAEISKRLAKARDQGLQTEQATLFAAEQLISQGHPNTALDLLKLTDKRERALQLTALALSLQGKELEARRILRNLRPSPETGGIEGGMLKRKWIQTGSAAWLEAAYQEYRVAYDRDKEDPEAYNPGINVAALALYLGRADESTTVAREVAKTIVAVPEDKRKPWQWASLAEASLLLGMIDEAATQYARAAQAMGPREIAVMRRQARSNLERLNLARDRLDAAFPPIGVAYLAPSSPAPVPGAGEEASLVDTLVDELGKQRITQGWCSGLSPGAPVFVRSLRKIGGSVVVHLPYPGYPLFQGLESSCCHYVSASSFDDLAAAAAACDRASCAGAIEMGALLDEQPISVGWPAGGGAPELETLSITNNS